MSTQTGADRDFERRFARVEGLLSELSSFADPRVEHLTREILSTVLELHQLGLARTLAACDERVRRTLADDAQVSAMLLLHGLHPLTLETRAERTIDGLRERLQSKLATVSADIHDGRVTLRVVPATTACTSTRATLKQEFETALWAAVPDAESVTVELAEPAPVLVTLRVRPRANDEHRQGGPR